MKIVCRSYVPDGPGTVEMIPEKEDDLWTAYTLINAGDTVSATTQKKIKRETKDRDSSKPGAGFERERRPNKESSKGGSYSTMRVTMKLEIRVEKKDYDKDSSYLRIKGKNVLHTEHVRVGTYHSLEIELNRSFVLWKPVWDSAALEAYKPSSDTDRVSIKPSSDTDRVNIKSSSDTERVNNGDANTKLSKEFEQALKKFFTMLLDSCATYGPRHVQAANELMAVQTLLITDDLFRSSDVKARQKYVNLVKSVEDSKGSVCILPADHAACKRLKELTGVAAILRFPLPDLEDV